MVPLPQLASRCARGSARGGAGQIHDFAPAPNPTKLRVYLNEKGIEIPRVMVNLVHGDQNREPFLSLNPLGAVPVLELGDGTTLCESLAIIEYFEELHPEPPMIGTDPLERAKVREIERCIDQGVLGRMARIVHSSRSPLPGVKPNPEVAEAERARLPRVLGVVDARIGSQPFVCGERPTIADCTLFAGIRFGQFGGIEVPDVSLPTCTAGTQAFSARPSTQ